MSGILLPLWAFVCQGIRRNAALGAELGGKQILLAVGNGVLASGIHQMEAAAANSQKPGQLGYKGDVQRLGSNDVVSKRVP